MHRVGSLNLTLANQSAFSVCFVVVRIQNLQALSHSPAWNGSCDQSRLTLKRVTNKSAQGKKKSFLKSPHGRQTTPPECFFLPLSFSLSPFSLSPHLLGNKSPLLPIHLFSLDETTSDSLASDIHMQSFPGINP